MYDGEKKVAPSKLDGPFSIPPKYPGELYIQMEVVDVLQSVQL